jgi:acyl-coenzyme A thioesterase PaaI-like protein
MKTTHEHWLDQLKNFPSDLELPPPSLKELELEYLEIIPGSKMVAKVLFQKRFTNPMGLYQGGILSGCIDEVFGPLSFLTANGPTMTLALNTTYLGAFKESMGHCLIEAMVLKKTKNFIFMKAEVKSPQGELLATSESHVKVV